MPRQSSISVSYPRRDLEIVANRIREGRFQRSLSLLTAGTSIASGLEVAYEHYRGSYSRRVMYTPVILSILLAMAGHGRFLQRSRGENRTSMDFGRNARGRGGRLLLPRARAYKRKPGGWRLPMTNMIMGPPVFAPLLFGTSAYLGLIASYLQREESTRCCTRLARDRVLCPASASRRGPRICSPRNRIFAKADFSAR